MKDLTDKQIEAVFTKAHQCQNLLHALGGVCHASGKGTVSYYQGVMATINWLMGDSRIPPVDEENVRELLGFLEEKP